MSEEEKSLREVENAIRNEVYARPDF